MSHGMSATMTWLSVQEAEAHYIALQSAVKERLCITLGGCTDLSLKQGRLVIYI